MFGEDDMPDNVRRRITNYANYFWQDYRRNRIFHFSIRLMLYPVRIFPMFGTLTVKFSRHWNGTAVEPPHRTDNHEREGVLVRILF